MPEAGRARGHRARLSAGAWLCVAALACGCAGKQKSQTLMPALPGWILRMQSITTMRTKTTTITARPTNT